MRRKAMTMLIGVAVLATAAATAEAKTHALVIGINSYPLITVNGVGGARDLRGATSDAQNMQQALIAHFDVKADEIKLLLDADASRDGILNNFNDWLIASTEPGDRVIFYYAGHGAQVEDTSGDEGDDKFDEVLVPADTKGELEGASAGLSGFITDDEIGGLLSKLSGRQVMMIVDACHSGTITRGALEVRHSGAADDPAGQGVEADGNYTGVRTLTPNGPIGVADLDDIATRDAHRLGSRMIEVVADTPADSGAATPTPAPAPTAATVVSSSTTNTASPQLAVWTAAASAQLAVEDLSLGGKQGLFTNRFVKGISEGAADLNKNGSITASELLSFLRGESDSYCAKFRCGEGGLSPTLEAWTGYDGQTLAQYAAATPAAYQGSPIASSDVIPQQGYATAGGVTVTLTGGAEIHYGDPLRVKVISDYAGDLVILDVRDDGTTVQLFPNAPSLKVGAQTTIQEHETRFLPGDEDPFELVPDKVGTGKIVALVVSHYATFSDLTGRYLNLEPIPSPDAYIAEISQAVNRAITYPTGSEAALSAPAKTALVARGEAHYEIK